MRNFVVVGEEWGSGFGWQQIWRLQYYRCRACRVQGQGLGFRATPGCQMKAVSNGRCLLCGLLRHAVVPAKSQKAPVVPLLKVLL